MALPRPPRAGTAAGVAPSAPPASPRLRERARAPTAREAAGIPWLAVLPPAERDAALAHVLVGQAWPGERVCRVGVASNFWFGVVDGLLKMGNDTAGGATINHTGLPPGAWFGEGTLLKREAYRYNVEALRASLVAALPGEVFHRLLAESIAFNRFVMTQLNERLGQFIAQREIDRLRRPESRVAASLASLFHPVLYPGVGGLLRITQQELAYLVGLSRQRVNRALSALAADGAIRIEYGGVRVIDLHALRSRERG